MGQAATDILTVHCVMTVPISFTSDDGGYYDDDDDDDRNDEKITIHVQTLLRRQSSEET
jgi:hypothetical protein